MAFTASRRVVGLRSNSAGREYSWVVRVSRSFTHFSARDGGFESVRFTGRAGFVLRSVRSVCSVRSDISGFALGAIVFWKREAWNFERSWLRASFFETVVGSKSA